MKKMLGGNSLVVQWLGLHTLTAEGPGLTPSQGTKIPQAVQCGQKKKKKVRNKVGDVTTNKPEIFKKLYCKNFDANKYENLGKRDNFLEN